MRYLSVCSGIEAASVAWHGLGWSPVAFSEIEPFPSAVLAHRFPGVPNLGDMTKFKEWPDLAIDLLVGGTPCQSFSVAGLRKGLADPRGNLALTYLAIADRYRPPVLAWENVPGVLSSNGGRDFGAFLGGLGQLGYGWAYRVLDAQFVRTCSHPFAVPQRRRRVFVVGCLGGWQRAAAVLFDGESLRGNPPPRRRAGQRPAGSLAARTTGGGGLGTDFDLDGGLIHCPPVVPQAMSSKWSKGSSGPAGDEVANLVAHQVSPPITHNPYGDHESRDGLLVAHSLRGEGFDASERPRKAKDGQPQAFLDALVGHNGNECVLWPFGRFKSGYGCLGKNSRAHRVMCEMAHGSAQSGLDAAHSCGNRLCVNPNHLRWADRTSNMADAIAHGTTTRGERHGGSKLTREDVLSVFGRLDAGETHQSIADSIGISRNAITDIAKGKNWAWLREDGTGRGTPLVPVAIQERAICENPNAGPDGAGVRQDGAAYTLEARTVPQAVATPVAFDCKGTEVQFAVDGSHPTLRSMGHNLSHQNAGGHAAVAQPIDCNKNETLYTDGVTQGESDASPQETYAGTLLRAVRDEVGEEAFAQWGLGILDTLQPPEILRSVLHGIELRPAAFSRRWVVHCALSRAEDRGAGALQSLQEACGAGRASCGWQPSEQRSIELGAYLSFLSQPGPQAQRLLFDLWCASEGLGLLRQALSAVQEARRPIVGEGQSASKAWQVRRLTVEECEFLQGFPRGWTDIPWRGKPTAPDGPRYKALGNSMAVNAMQWIGERIAMVEGLE